MPLKVCSSFGSIGRCINEHPDRFVGWVGIDLSRRGLWRCHRRRSVPALPLYHQPEARLTSSKSQNSSLTTSDASCASWESNRLSRQ
jgi:hypothetical protein